MMDDVKKESGSRKKNTVQAVSCRAFNLMIETLWTVLKRIKRYLGKASKGTGRGEKIDQAKKMHNLLNKIQWLGKRVVLETIFAAAPTKH